MSFSGYRASWARMLVVMAATAATPNNVNARVVIRPLLCRVSTDVAMCV